MDTEWDDDRILARVETRAKGGSGQIEIDGAQSLVVRLYDCGPATGRADAPRLIYDSERAEGFSGLFDGSAKAERFKRRAKAAHLHGMRLRETVEADRKLHLPERLELRELEVEEAMGEAKEARGRAKAAQRAQRKLWHEANSPQVVIECPPSGKGYAIVLAPSETDGPKAIVLASTLERRPEEEPAELPSKLEDVLAETEKAWEAKAQKLPPSVPGSSGPRLKPGMRVHVEEPGVEPWVGELVSILRQDDAGAYWIEVTDSAGVVHEVKAEHCRKAKKGEG